MDGRNVLHATGVPGLVRATQLATLRLEGRIFGAPPTPDARDRLRILACTPTYVPEQRRGAEVTLHAVLRDLLGRGHEVRVLRTETGGAGVIDGIEVRDRPHRRGARELGEWADVIVGQLDARSFVLRLGARSRRPVAYWMHMGNVDRRALFGHPDLTVFASTTVRQQYPWITNALVVHPPVVEADYVTTRGDAVTLVTYSEPKGARVFDALARRLGNRPFLTIATETMQPPSAPNITVLDPVVDMRTVYARTRILLMPSVYESYGRVGLEAAASGIPTVAHPAAGIREALGDAALFVVRDDIDKWVEAICSLDAPDEYARRAELARRRFETVDPSSEIDALEARLRALASASKDAR
jgi:hypothetical protein